MIKNLFKRKKPISHKDDALFYVAAHSSDRKMPDDSSLGVFHGNVEYEGRLFPRNAWRHYGVTEGEYCWRGVENEIELPFKHDFIRAFKVNMTEDIRKDLQAPDHMRVNENFYENWYDFMSGGDATFASTQLKEAIENLLPDRFQFFPIKLTGMKTGELLSDDCWVISPIYHIFPEDRPLLGEVTCDFVSPRATHLKNFYYELVNNKKVRNYFEELGGWCDFGKFGRITFTHDIFRKLQAGGFTGLYEQSSMNSLSRQRREVFGHVWDR